MFFLQQNQRTRGLNRFCPERWDEGVERRWPKQCIQMWVNTKTIKFKKIK
jgi:hypothetical protein